MNKIFLPITTAVALLLTACGTDTDTNIFTLEKDSKISIKDVDTLLIELKRDYRYPNQASDKRILLRKLDISADINSSNFSKMYRFTFPYKVVKEDINGYTASPNSINIDFCKNELKTQIDNMTQSTPLLENEISFNRGQNSYSVVMTFEKLNQRNLINPIESEQEDICMYIKTTTTVSVMSGDKVSINKSNVLRYTADEIITAVGEYKSLLQ